MTASRGARKLKRSEDAARRKEVERLVEASETRFRAIFEKSMDHITIVDPEGRILHESSPERERALGYTRNELVGQPGFDYMHPDDVPRVKEVFQRLAQTPGAASTFEVRFRHKDGSWRFLVITGTNLTHIEEVGGIVINFRDVTDRKLAEQALRESEERFRRLFEGAPVGVVIVTGDTKILRANDAFCRLLGYDEAELLGRRTVDLTHPDDRDSTTEAVRSYLAGGTPTYRMEKRYLAKGGEPVWTDVAASVVRGDAGQLLYAVGIIQDITGKKRAEEQLRAYQERLRQLAAYVVNAREEERTRIAREIHDELGQMLTALRLGLDNLGAYCSEDCIHRVEVGRRIAGMSEQLKVSVGTVKRIAAELRPGVLDHLGLTAAIEWQAREFQAATGIPCVIREMPDKLVLPADRSTAVFRILQEILTNVTRHANASNVRLRLRAGRKWVSMVVEDDGIGIPENEVHALRSLGLLGMRERAELLGGTIQFKGVPGKGTTVTLRLPASE